MTARWYYDDPGGVVEITDRIDRIAGWTLQERAEEGGVASSSVVVADPDMDIEFIAHRRVWVIEDDSTDTDDVLWGGWTGEQTIARAAGDELHPAGRVWELELLDWNTVWPWRVITGATADRAEETDVERVEWALGLAAAGIFDDVTSFVHSGSTVDMDAADLRRKYLDEPISDCAQATDKNYWAKLIETGAGRESFAWYGYDTETTYTSDLSLSNDPGDLDPADLADGSSLVWPLGADTRLKRSGARQYNGVLVEWADGAVYRHDSGSTFERRDFIVPAGSIKTQAKAIARANKYLTRLADQHVVITTQVRLPAAIATKLRAGMRVGVKGLHLEDFDAGEYLRVASCSITSVQGGAYYDLGLELTNILVTRKGDFGSSEGGTPTYDGDDVDWTGGDSGCTCECTCEDCDDFDDLFDRMETDAVGNEWTIIEGSDSDYSVDGDELLIATGTGGDGEAWRIRHAIAMDVGGGYADFFHDDTDPSVAYTAGSINVYDLAGSLGIAQVGLDSQGENLTLQTEVDSDSVAVSIDVTQPLRIEFEIGASTVSARVYNLSDPPPAWDIELALGPTTTADTVEFAMSNNESVDPLTVHLQRVHVSCAGGSGGSVEYGDDDPGSGDLWYDTDEEDI